MPSSDPPPSSPTAEEETWTVGRLLAWTQQRFAQVGIDSPRIDAEHLREEHLLRVAQERGSLAADVLALAALRREQLLDVARTEGAALLLFADAALMLATAGMLIVLMVGSDGGPFALLRLLQQ